MYSHLMCLSADKDSHQNRLVVSQEKTGLIDATQTGIGYNLFPSANSQASVYHRMLAEPHDPPLMLHTKDLNNPHARRAT